MSMYVMQVCRPHMCNTLYAILRPHNYASLPVSLHGSQVFFRRRVSFFLAQAEEEAGASCAAGRGNAKNEIVKIITAILIISNTKNSNNNNNNNDNSNNNNNNNSHSHTTNNNSNAPRQAPTTAPLPWPPTAGKASTANSYTYTPVV